MIFVGIDAVEISRCAKWHNYCDKTLYRIFSPEEIAYCRQNNSKSAERFAVRFAAKEAFYKALCQAHPAINAPFLSVAPLALVEHGATGVPHLSINWTSLAIESMTSSVSLTHTQTTAVACIILYQKNGNF